MSDARANQAPPDEAEYREQVLERFTARARSLVNQFTILMIFAFGFLVFIIVPLAALNFDAAHVDAQQDKFKKLTDQSNVLEAERAAQEQEVGILQGNITSLNFVLEIKSQEAKARAGDRKPVKNDLAQNDALRKKQQEQVQILKSAVKGMERTLASFDAGQRVSNLRDWFFNTALGGPRDSDCEGNDERVYLRCLVKKKLEADWQNDFSVISQEIVEPLRKIAPSIAGAIEGEMLAVKKTFHNRLEANQDFWQSLAGKEVFMEGLLDDFDAAFQNIKSIVNQRLDKVTQQLKGLKAEIAALTLAGQKLEKELAALDQALMEIESETASKSLELDAKKSAIANIESAQAALLDQIGQLKEQLAKLPDLADIEKERKDIEARLASFESPFGAIPIGLKEAVLAYPLILAAGFLVCTLLLSRLLALRREFRNSLVLENALSDANVERRVATLAPLWFDPGRAFWANPALVLALLIPFALFVATGWLILNDWLLQLGETASAINLRWFYSGLYGLGLAVFAASLFRVQSAWSRDRDTP